MCLDLIVAQSADSRDQRQGDVRNHRDLQEPDEDEPDDLQPAHHLAEEDADQHPEEESEQDLPSAPVYICPVCGFTVIGDPPAKCPVSKTPSEKFVKF